MHDYVEHSLTKEGASSMYRPRRNYIVKQTRKQVCPQCNGSGQVLNNSVWSFGWKPCTACHGTGQIEIPIIPESYNREY